MAQVFLHIGTHKTGTTSIQYFLNYCKQDLLAQGILFPEAGKLAGEKMSGNHHLPWIIKNKKGMGNAKDWNDLQEEIEKYNIPKVVVSAEDFEILSDEQIGKIMELLNGHEIFIIIYFRNYKDYLKSIYAMFVRNQQESRPFNKAVGDILYFIDYGEILRKWAKYIDNKNIVVRLYDEVVSRGDLLLDFSRIIGFVPPAESPYLGLKRNISPTEHATNAILLLNRIEKTYPLNLLLGNKIDKYRKSIHQNNKEHRWLKRILFALSKKQFFTEKESRYTESLIGQINSSEILSYIDNEALKYLKGSKR